MNEQITAILERLDALQAEMSEHRNRMRQLLQRDDSEWVTELEKYYAARQSLLHEDEQLGALLRSRVRAA
jgi:hypothetical protein